MWALPFGARINQVINNLIEYSRRLKYIADLKTGLGVRHVAEKRLHVLILARAG